MTIDYSGIADQVKGPINSGWFGGGQTTARVAFKYLMGAGEMANEGTFRPLKLILPPGKILSADPTAPMGNYSTPFPTVIDAVIKALEQALPARVPGGHFGTHSGVRFHGRRADGSFFGTHDCGHGGWGACATHDGAGPFRTMAHGDTRIIPLELQETYLPVRIEEFSLREDSGGAGKFRGGLGFRKRYRMLAPCGLQTNLDRTQISALGRAGRQGRPARPLHPGRRRDRRASGRSRRRKALQLKAGDLVCVETGGGGGYGPPQSADTGAHPTRPRCRLYFQGGGRARLWRDGRCRRQGAAIGDASDASEFLRLRRSASISVLAALPSTRAETVEEFYRGKTIKMYVGTGPGGGAVSGYPMALAQVIRKYIPGNPNARRLAHAGRRRHQGRDLYRARRAAGRHRLGLHHPRLHAGAAAQAAAGGFRAGEIQLDRQPRAGPCRWALVWNAHTPVRTIQDAMQQEVVVGATSIAQDTGIYPRALNQHRRHQVQDRHRLCRPRRRRHRDAARRGAGQGRLDLGLAQLRARARIGSRTRSSPCSSSSA